MICADERTILCIWTSKTIITRRWISEPALLRRLARMMERGEAEITLQITKQLAEVDNDKCALCGAQQKP